jgi:hypothetical protein
MKRRIPDEIRVKLDEHFRAGGRFKKLILHFLFLLSRIKIIKHFGIFETFISKVEGLVIGITVENIEDSKINLPESSQKIEDNLTEVSKFRTPITSRIFDHIVIGSGPGGAISTSCISENESILIIEAGIFPQTLPQAHHTLDHVLRDFKNGGQELIFNSELSQFAQGRVLGGGSEVNSGLYHKLPETKVNEFLSRARISLNDWNIAEAEIYNLLKISKSPALEEKSLIARGSQKIGLEFQNIPRWRTYKQDGLYEHHGMIDVVWKKIFTKNNIFFAMGTQVLKIKSEKNHLVLGCKDSSGKFVEYRAKNLVISAGATGSPFLLAQNNYIKWRDTDFQWHPMYRAIVRTDKVTLGFGDIDPYQSWTEDYSLKFGSAVSTPGLLGVALGRSIFSEEINQLRSYYFSFSSSGKGGLIPFTNVPWYKFSTNDKTLKKNGTELLTRILREGGGTVLDSKNPVNQKSSTVHIFGSLPLDSSIYESGTLRIKEEPRIKVADGSILPIGPGVNPQAVIMSTVKAIFNK